MSIYWNHLIPPDHVQHKICLFIPIDSNINPNSSESIHLNIPIITSHNNKTFIPILPLYVDIYLSSANVATSQHVSHYILISTHCENLHKQKRVVQFDTSWRSHSTLLYSFITSHWHSRYFHVSSLKSDALHASPNQAWQNGSQKGVVQICCDNGQTWLWPAVQLGSLSVLSSCLSLHPVIWPSANLTWMSYFVHLLQYLCCLKHVYVPIKRLMFNILNSTAVTQFCFYWAEMIKKIKHRFYWVSPNPSVFFLMLQCYVFYKCLIFVSEDNLFIFIKYTLNNAFLDKIYKFKKKM